MIEDSLGGSMLPKMYVRGRISFVEWNWSRGS